MHMLYIILFIYLFIYCFSNNNADISDYTAANGETVNQ